MSDELGAAIITGLGSIVAAAITGVTTLTAERIKNGALPRTSRWMWLKATGYWAAAGIVIGASIWVFSLVYDGTYRRLNSALPDLSEHKKRIYAKVGLGFVYPSKWQLEDYAFRFGGGEMELVRDRSSDGRADIETQGVSIAVENIAAHHWNKPQSEYVHFSEELKKKCDLSFVGPEKAVISGWRQADLFKCSRSSETETQGKKTGEERTYFYQLSKCVRLKIETWSWLSGPPQQEFYEELDEFLHNLMLDEAKKNTSAEFCVSSD